MLRIRRMHVADIPFATRLTNLEEWGIPRRDFARILRLDGRGSFVATEGRRRVGLATTAHYGRRIAWIGNVVVQKRYRQRHIGQQLIRHAIDYLSNARVRHIALYCFKENVRFYRKLGFVQGSRFVRLRREPRARLATLAESSFKRLPLCSLLAMDRKAFGADRGPLITAILREGVAWYGGFQTAASASYVLVKSYDDMNEIGPWIAFGLNSNRLDSLLRLVIDKSGSKAIEVTCPATNNRAITMMRKRGFRLINEGRVMFYRRRVGIGLPRAIVAHGFLDKG